MRPTISIAFGLILAGLAGCARSSRDERAPNASVTPTEGEIKHGLAYPPTRKIDHVDDYNGVKVADPYRWLEDADGSETRQWVTEENKVTFAYLSAIPTRARMKERLTARWNYERWGVPTHAGSAYLVDKNDGLQNQAVLYALAALNGEPRVLLDPNTLSQTGTTALSSYDVTDDGKKIVYGLAAAGSDWVEMHVRDVATGADLSDVVKWTKFSTPQWTGDGKGFYYARFPEPSAGATLEAANYDQKLYYHKLGTAQGDDALVYERPDHKEWMFDTVVTDDGKYLVINVVKGTDELNMVLVQELGATRAVAPLMPDFDAEYAYVANDGPVFYFRTTYQAPRGRVIAVDVRSPGKEHWREIVREDGATLVSASCVGSSLFLNYLQDARSAVRVHDLRGKLVREVTLPGLGTARGFDGRRRDGETFYSFESFMQPRTIYRYDVKTGASSVFKAPHIDADLSAFETTQVFATSKDGTKVPMFVTRKRGAPLDGNAPTLLYGYGGFNIPITPWFNVPFVTWVELGGTLAVANLRGGGEYGREWHLAGTRERKQNVFDDFFAAAEYLTANAYTKPSRLAIHGRSNGGLLVGAAITQRPELFGAALPAVGVMDMLRFDTFTIGRSWVDDYGTPSNPAEFPALRAYSPYHNVRDGVHYPATLVTTADHDDRVVPAHSFKFISALQAAQAGEAPVLIRIDTQAGHGAGKPTSKRIDEAADELAFAFHALGADDVVMASR